MSTIVHTIFLVGPGFKPLTLQHDLFVGPGFKPLALLHDLFVGPGFDSLALIAYFRPVCILGLCHVVVRFGGLAQLGVVCNEFTK